MREVANFRLPCSAFMACLLLIGLAAPCDASSVRKTAASPELAAGLAVGTPLGLMALARFSPEPLAAVVLPAIGLGAGHLYAGKPWRGAVVSVGSAAAGIGVFNLLRPADQAGGGTLHTAVMAGAIAALTLAAIDAYSAAGETEPSYHGRVRR